MNSRIDNQQLDRRLHELFGADANSEHPLAPSGAGVRLSGLDLCQSLSPEQVEFLLDALSTFRIVCIGGQDLQRFSLAHFERFANHWGAPIPHPSNFLRGGKPAQQDGASDGEFELIPFHKRNAAKADTTLPGELQCLSHESPAVLVATNLMGKAEAGDVRLIPGRSWHTDVEYEQLPIYVSMFLAHISPSARDDSNGTWVPDPSGNDCDTYFEGSDDELMRLRKQLPLNGETAYADTAAAFAALPIEEQAALQRVQVRRRLNEADEGWLAPLVRTDPRSRIKSLHSPVWASRPRVRPAIEVDGMNLDESRVFLDRLEAHVLQPQFRYDHLHVPGDVTIWNNYMTLHAAPPIKSNINSLNDARLLYRLSCKGDPALSLPRNDEPQWLATHIAGGYSTPQAIVNV